MIIIQKYRVKHRTRTIQLLNPLSIYVEIVYKDNIEISSL